MKRLQVGLVSALAIAMTSAMACNIGDDPSGVSDEDAGVSDEDASSPSDTAEDDASTADTEEDAFDFSTRCEPDSETEPSPLPELNEPEIPHENDPEVMHDEHVGMIELVDYDEATHVSVDDGFWCNPATWHNGEVPGDDARVVIHEDTDVIYDIESDASLFTVRVDGTLEFATDVSSTIVFDTMVVDQRGDLIVGTADDPVEEDAEVNFVIADNGDIDTSWDPLLMSRGLLAHGKSRIHGQQKTTHLKVTEDPEAGDTELVLAEKPENWQAGDTLVLAGTRYSGWKWDNDIEDVRYHGTRDEVLTVTDVDEQVVSFEPPLEYDHPTPREDLKTSVANFTRNVNFLNENDEVPVHRRGHVMFMHSDDIDVRYASFWRLGRTDKSTPAFAVETLDDVDYDTNIQGRYSLHFHRTGIDNPRRPAMAVGNAVFGAPGWGYVHHDAHAIFDDNASFDTFGAGFVGETGNETGSWSNNIAIRAEGSSSFNPKNGVDNEIFDMARTGAGFWFQGRKIRALDNIAASVNHGHVYFHRGDGMLRFDAQYFAFPEALNLDPQARPNHPPILHFHGNEAFASEVGLFVVKANPNQGHDVRSWMSDFTGWELRAGAELEYTSHYTLKDFDLIGSTPESFRDPLTGIKFGPNSSDMTIIDARIENYETGIYLGKHFTSNAGGDELDPAINTYVVVEPEFIDVDEEYAELDTSVDELLSSDELQPERFELEIDDLESLYYSSSYPDERVTHFSGTKTDSIGEIPFPAGTDRLRVQRSGMVRILEQRGYYVDDNDTPYVIVEQYFSDRATGEVHKRGIPVRLEDDVPLHSEYHPYEHAVEKGPIDFDAQPPETADVEATTTVDTEVVIDVLDNDTDPDGGELQVRGIFDPHYGMVFDNEDGTITYRPDPGFVGESEFTYWAHDGQGNFTPATVTVTVTP